MSEHPKLHSDCSDRSLVPTNSRLLSGPDRSRIHPSDTVRYLPFKLGMAKIFNMAKMCLKPKKRHTAPVPFQYKKNFLGVGGRRGPQRGRSDDPARHCAPPRDLQRLQRRKHRKPTPPMQRTRANSCSQPSNSFFKRWMGVLMPRAAPQPHCPSLRTLRAPPPQLCRGATPASEICGAQPVLHFHSII